MSTTERVQQILSWYASETPGTRTQLFRLLNSGALAGTGKLVILPVDQGFEHGPVRSFAPNPPAHDPLYHFKLALDQLLAIGFVLGGHRAAAGERITRPNLPREAHLEMAHLAGAGEIR